MQSMNRNFLEILRIPHAEVWLVKDTSKYGVALSKGNLEVLYNKALNLFVIRVDDSQFGLGKSIQVVGTYSETSKYHAYLFADPEGLLIFKVFDTDPTIPIENFETILHHTTQFVRKSGLEHRLETFTFSSHKAKDTIPKSTINNSHPNQRMIRTFDELLDIKTNGVPVVDIPSDVVQKLIDQGKELVSSHQESEQWKEYMKWGGVDGDTITTGHALPKDHENMTELGDQLDELHYGGSHKNLRHPAHVDPSQVGRIPADVVANTDM